MNVDDEALAAYQSALLEALHRGTSPAEVKSTLAENEMAAPYVQHFEPRMVELGMHLVKKWGRRR